MFRPLVHGRVAVFIDAANLERALSHLGWWIDYRRLADYLKRETDLQTIRHYCPRFEQPAQDKFLTFLKKTGFVLVTKPLKTIADHTLPAGHFRKANFDVEIALDAYDHLDRYDTLLLFSGDSDFDYLIQILHRHHKRVVVVSSRNHVARELVARADRFVDLKHLRPHVERTQKPGK